MLLARQSLHSLVYFYFSINICNLLKRKMSASPAVLLAPEVYSEKEPKCPSALSSSPVFYIDPSENWRPEGQEGQTFRNYDEQSVSIFYRRVNLQIRILIPPFLSLKRMIQFKFEFVKRTLKCTSISRWILSTKKLGITANLTKHL